MSIRSGASAPQWVAVSSCRAGRGRGGRLPCQFSFKLSCSHTVGMPTLPVEGARRSAPRRRRRRSRRTGRPSRTRGRGSGRGRGRRTGTAQRLDHGAGGRRLLRGPELDGIGGRQQLGSPGLGSGRRRNGGACAPPTSPSTRGPPASPSSGWSRPRPVLPAASSPVTIAAWVYSVAIMPGVHAGVVGEERVQPMAARGVAEVVGAPLGDRGEVGGDDEEVEDVGDRGAVEVPLDSTGRPWSRPGCRRQELEVRDLGAAMTPSRTAPATCGEHRSE